MIARDPQPTCGGVADATQRLYSQYGRQIYAFCLHYLRSREEAEDAVQTTFLNAFRGLQRGTTTHNEQAWLYKIAQHVCVARCSSAGRRLKLEAPNDFVALEEMAPARSSVDSLELMGLEDALESMPEKQRRAILLREWQGLSYREIAEDLSLSQGAVEMLIFRARRTLAHALDASLPDERSLGQSRSGAGVGSLLTAFKSLYSVAMAAKMAAVAVSAAVVTTGVSDSIVTSVVHRVSPPTRAATVHAHAARAVPRPAAAAPQASSSRTAGTALVSWRKPPSRPAPLPVTTPALDVALTPVAAREPPVPAEQAPPSPADPPAAPAIPADPSPPAAVTVTAAPPQPTGDAAGPAPAAPTQSPPAQPETSSSPSPDQRSGGAGGGHGGGGKSADRSHRLRSQDDRTTAATSSGGSQPSGATSVTAPTASPPSVGASDSTCDRTCGGGGSRRGDRDRGSGRQGRDPPAPSPTDATQTGVPAIVPAPTQGVPAADGGAGAASGQVPGAGDGRRGDRRRSGTPGPNGPQPEPPAAGTVPSPGPVPADPTAAAPSTTATTPGPAAAPPAPVVPSDHHRPGGDGGGTDGSHGHGPEHRWSR